MKSPLLNTSSTTELDVLKSILDIVARMQTQSKNSNFSSASKADPQQKQLLDPNSNSQTIARGSLTSDMSKYGQYENHTLEKVPDNILP